MFFQGGQIGIPPDYSIRPQDIVITPGIRDDTIDDKKPPYRNTYEQFKELAKKYGIPGDEMDLGETACLLGSN